MENIQKMSTIYISSGNKEIVAMYKKDHIIMYPFKIGDTDLDESLVTEKNLWQQKFKKLIISDILVVAPDYLNDKDKRLEVFIAQEAGLKIIFEDTGNEFDRVLSLTSEVKKSG